MIYRSPRPPFGEQDSLFDEQDHLFQQPDIYPGPGPTIRPFITTSSDTYGRPDRSNFPGRPPTYVPEEPSILQVDPGAIRRCKYKFTYLWLKGGRQFWAYLTFVGPRSVSGYRWIGRWVYFGTDLKNIKAFVCL